MDSHKPAGREAIELGIVGYKYTSDSSGISLKDSHSLTNFIFDMMIE